MFTRQNFTLVTSISLAGSQNDTGMPMRGIGFSQVQRISLGLLVSSPLGDTFSPQIVMGNKQLQHMSVAGLTNLPVHLPYPSNINNKEKMQIKNLMRYFPLFRYPNCFFDNRE
jgi:hypothetical protein